MIGQREGIEMKKLTRRFETLMVEMRENKETFVIIADTGRSRCKWQVIKEDEDSVNEAFEDMKEWIWNMADHSQQANQLMNKSHMDWKKFLGLTISFDEAWADLLR